MAAAATTKVFAAKMMLRCFLLALMAFNCFMKLRKVSPPPSPPSSPITITAATAADKHKNVKGQRNVAYAQYNAYAPLHAECNAPSCSCLLLAFYKPAALTFIATFAHWPAEKLPTNLPFGPGRRRDALRQAINSRCLWEASQADYCVFQTNLQQ